jgi:hypothetical protein
VNIKVTGVVKHLGKWYTSGDVIKDINEDDGRRIITIRAGEEIQKTPEEIKAEEEAKATAEAEKAQKAAEKKLASLRKQATELGIAGAEEMDADTLLVEIKVAKQK